MLTVKLVSRVAIRIIEAVNVDVVEIPEQETYRQVILSDPARPLDETIYTIVPEREKDTEAGEDMPDNAFICAYIMNEAGQTIETVRP